MSDVAETVVRQESGQQLSEEAIELAAKICSIANSARSEAELLRELGRQLPSWETATPTAACDVESFTQGVQRFLCQEAWKSKL